MITFSARSTALKSTQEAWAKCFAVHILKFEILQNHLQKNDANQTLSFQFFTNRFSILMGFFWIFSCVLQDFKFQYVNRKAFGASFLYWVDFKETKGFNIAFFICNVSKKRFFNGNHQRWKPYMANILDKTWNKGKLLLNLVIQRSRTLLRAAPEQLSIPFNKLPVDGRLDEYFLLLISRYNHRI